MNYHVKKRFYLIKIGLLLLTALCAKTHASTGGWQSKLLSHLPEPSELSDKATIISATILYSIDTSSCYDWFTSMNKRNARRMGRSFMAQLWKIVWLGMVVAVASQDDDINPKLIIWVAISKLIVDSLEWLVRSNSKIATMLSYWSLGLAMIHLCVRVAKNQTLANYSASYDAFVLAFGLYYLVSFVQRNEYKKYFANKLRDLEKKIIGPENTEGYLFSMYKIFSYCLFSCLVGAACHFISSAVPVPGLFNQLCLRVGFTFSNLALIGRKI
ncbi:MAG: hypothetical protein AAF900_01435 [Bacteroidota bacterium]